ncbi:MAG: zinc ribbon domain-containing protein [Clostridia bacterium]|nr:zinc ribbon domain-containing protein [Clostridia bacterium]
MRMMRERSDRRLLTSDRLLTGLVYCGRCGARMRYQKWGQKGYKLTCYSQQTSKAYLIHDPDCDNEKPWADEAEEAVVRDFLGRRLEESGGDAEQTEVSPEELLNQQLQIARKKLSRLYSLYADQDDELLLESIEQQRKNIAEINQRILREKALREEQEKKYKTHEKIRQLSEAWEYMTVDEKRAVLREAIERIEIDGARIDISYRI